MRDPNRLESLYNKIAQLHKMVPDQRISQFLINVLSEFKIDPFYLEDNEFVEKLEKIVSNWISTFKEK